VLLLDKTARLLVSKCLNDAEEVEEKEEEDGGN
jgi:hypothetical protein